jgi:DsbC/DsbD-like thiol-disulfide interchange protein
MQTQFSISNVLLFCGLLISLLIQPSCSRPVPDGVQQNGEPAENGPKVAQVIEDRPHEQAVDKRGPVSATLRVDPAEVRAGGLVTLVIEARIAAGWHIYAIDKPAGVAVPSKIRLRSPTFVEETEGWAADHPPKTELQGQELIHLHDGNVTFRCPVRVSKDAPKGTARVQCVLQYQACDRFSCQPPEELTLETEVSVLP